MKIKKSSSISLYKGRLNKKGSRFIKILQGVIVRRSYFRRKAFTLACNKMLTLSLKRNMHFILKNNFLYSNNEFFINLGSSTAVRKPKHPEVRLNSLRQTKSSRLILDRKSGSKYLNSMNFLEKSYHLQINEARDTLYLNSYINPVVSKPNLNPTESGRKGAVAYTSLKLQILKKLTYGINLL